MKFEPISPPEISCALRLTPSHLPRPGSPTFPPSYVLFFVVQWLPWLDPLAKEKVC